MKGQVNACMNEWLGGMAGILKATKWPMRLRELPDAYTCSLSSSSHGRFQAQSLQLQRESLASA